ncbi:hypothetical protein AB0M36_21000 [Actinoplanes sp. NPDC051346]|uniref:hypothetical protein n=1 Tax=Actinoplanes sp. NPDC051346 TaxID=3155048 RepID=UPI0034172228
MIVKFSLVAALSVGFLSGCGSAPSVSQTSPSSAASTGATVAAYFNPPQPHPGPAWSRAGRQVGPEEVSTSAGSDHCGWQTATFLGVGSSHPGFAVERRVFFRDPGGVLPRSPGKLVIGASLPEDARDTGYRLGDLQLWLASSDPTGAYLRVETDIERWPRSGPAHACD